MVLFHTGLNAIELTATIVILLTALSVAAHKFRQEKKVPAESD